MLGSFREKVGAALVTLIIGLIALVFIFSGVFSPPSGGMRGGAFAGSVNGENISLAEFNRELNRRMEFFKQLGGGTMTEEQLRMFRIHEGVFNELVNRKLMRQAAEDRGLVASDAEIREAIVQIPAFQKDGKFDSLTYKQVLEANNYTPGGFERMMREDLTLQQWGRYFRNRAQVSEEEARREYLITQDQRNIKYALITPESVAKAVEVPKGEIDQYLADAAKLNVAQGVFDRKKETVYKGKKFDDVKTEIARELVAAGKSDQLKKISEDVATKVAAVMTTASASDARVNAILKPYGLQVRSTGLFNRTLKVIPGVGDAKELLTDAFSEDSPIGAGGKAKSYSIASGIVVAVVSESKKADLAGFDQEREKIMAKLVGQKERSLYESVLKQLRAKADLEVNRAVVGEIDLKPGQNT